MANRSRRPRGKPRPSILRRSLRILLLWGLGLAIGFLIPYLGWLQLLVDQAMAEAHWSTPSRVFARPLALERGTSLSPDRLQRELDWAGYRPGDTGPGSYRRSGARFDIHNRGQVPGTATRLTLEIRQGRVTQLESDGQAELDPMLLGTVHGARDRLPVSLGDVPPLLVYALQAVEDRSFKHHRGLSPRSIARAAWVNLREGEIVQGGSTLTQQLVKTLFLSRERSWLRKFHEAALAMLMEARFGKDQILEAYLNAVFLGQDGQTPIHGVGRAAEFYFQRPLQQLDLAQLTLLVGMLKGPSYYNPWRHPERARERRDLVLRSLYETGVISRSQWQSARTRPLGVRQGTRRARGGFPGYLGLVRQQLNRSSVTAGGLRIVTALDPAYQQAAESALQQGLDRIEQQRGLPAGVLEGAVLLADRSSGAVLAAVGGRDPRYPGFNRVRDARRPVGSLVKPFVYLTALAEPERYSLVTPLADQPLDHALDDGSRWSPRNFDDRSHGPVRLMDALVHSYNQASARLGLEVGVDAVLETLQALGYPGRPPPHPSLLLGALEWTPLEAGQLYLSLANGGRAIPLNAISSVLDAAGEERLRSRRASHSATPRSEAWLTDFALRQVVDRGTARALSRRLGSEPGQLGGKTGTTNGFRDSWFAGYSKDLVAVIWVGRDDNQEAGITGATAALEVFADLFATVPWSPLDPQPPVGVEFHWITVEGTLADDHCPERDYLPFAQGHLPADWAACAKPKRRWRFWPFGE